MNKAIKRVFSRQEVLVLVFFFLLTAGCGSDLASPTVPIAPSETLAPTVASTATRAPTQTPTPTTQPSPKPFQCQDYQKTVVMLVEPFYLDPLAEALARYEKDLCQNQYRLMITPSHFETPEEIREYLRQLYFEGTQGTLIGAILVGEIPYAYQKLTIEFIYTEEGTPPRLQENISMQYYMDLDGEFLLSEEYEPVNGEEPLGEPIFDTHRGDTDWEIWVSVLPPFHADRGQTTVALLIYFDKNHAYRTGEIDLPKTYLYLNSRDIQTEVVYEEMMEAFYHGSLNWTPLARDGDPLIYTNYPPKGLSEEDGYQALMEGVADFTIIQAHGHQGAAGLATAPWVLENPIKTIFLWTYCCYVGDLDNPHVILNLIVYDPKSLVLFAVGNSSDSGGLGTNLEGPFSTNIATDLAEGLSIGQAILNNVNVPMDGELVHHPDLVLSTKVFYGDLTLKVTR